MKGIVTFNLDRCKGCGLCVAICPVQCLRLNTQVTNIKGYHPSGIAEPEKCIACGSCAKICPDSVITVQKIVEK